MNFPQDTPCRDRRVKVGRSRRTSRTNARKLAVEELERYLLMATFLVDSPGDSGDFDLGDGVADTDRITPESQITLRAAIQNANLDPTRDTIGFAAPMTIRPLAALPAITAPVNLSGASTPGYAGTPLVTIDGGSAGATDGPTLAVGSSGSTVSGLFITRFAQSGLVVQGAGDVVQGNTISGNRGSGVVIAGANARDNLVLGNRTRPVPPAWPIGMTGSRFGRMTT